MDPTNQPNSISESPFDAPPQYTSPQVWGSTPPPISEKAPHTEDTLTHQSTSAAYPAESLPSHPRGPRLLHIYHRAPLSHDLIILAADKTTTAYTIHANSGSLFSSKPHMKIYRGVFYFTQPDPPIGTVTFHSTTRTVDLTLHGSRYGFPSSTGVLCWRSSGGFGRDMVCETAEGEWVAKFEATVFALEKKRRFEILSWDVGDERVDEIVVSGLAAMEQRSRKKSRGVVGGGWAGAGPGVGPGPGPGGAAFAVGC